MTNLMKNIVAVAEGSDNLHALIIVAIVMGAIACVVGLVCVALLAKRKSGGGVSVEDLKRENDILRGDVKELENDIKMSNAMTSGVLTTMQANNKEISTRVENMASVTSARLENLRQDQYNTMNGLKDTIVATINEMKAANVNAIAEVRNDNARNLESIKKDNAEQLKQMRDVVDEKLSSTLEKRFDASFKIVNSRLEEINRTFAELQGLQSGISDLNKLFSNVKARGTWGEVALENLLSQILAPEQYGTQVQIKRGSQDVVDFVIKMPGKGEGEVLLPIDSKFPTEDYARLCEASEKADKEGIEIARKALSARIKKEAMTIRDKYINVPKTTNFAIMYLPTESLYAEVLRIDGLAEEVQVKHRIMLCGPTTIAALLNSLQMGFKSIAAEKHSAEIVKLFRAFVVDFDKFTELLQKTGKQLDTVQSTIEDAEKRTSIIKKKLDKMSKYDDENSIAGGVDMPMLNGDGDDPFADVDGGEIL